MQLFSRVDSTDSSTPLMKSLSKAHLNNIRSSTSKTLLDEYINTFNSKKTPLTDKRKTISNITMDIIKQRIENINRNASFNQSSGVLNDSLLADVKSTPTHGNAFDTATPKMPTPEILDTAMPTTKSNGNAVQLKPLKRKLFAPPSLFPGNSPLSSTTLTPKTDKKTATQKRKRVDPLNRQHNSDEKKKNPIGANKTTNSRRSTMFFEQPPLPRLNATETMTKTAATTLSTKNREELTGLVCTSMHQSQIDAVKEVCKA